jgi:hypothetical protein
MAYRLTKPMLRAIRASLSAHLAGRAFDGGDLDGENEEHYARARQWAGEQLDKRDPGWRDRTFDDRKQHRRKSPS